MDIKKREPTIAMSTLNALAEIDTAIDSLAATLEQEVSTVTIFDNDNLRLQTLGFFIEQMCKDINIVGKAKTSKEFKHILQNWGPNLAIIVASDDIPWLRSAIEITSLESFRTKVLGIVGNITNKQLQSLAKSGISGLVSKSSPLDEILSAIQMVDQNHVYFSPAFKTDERFMNVLKNTQVELTNRENEILSYLLRGFSNRDIAGKLVVTENTVKSHIGKVFKKLDVKTRQEAIVYAINNGLMITTYPDNSALQR